MIIDSVRKLLHKSLTPNRSKERKIRRLGHLNNASHNCVAKHKKGENNNKWVDKSNLRAEYERPENHIWTIIEKGPKRHPSVQT